MPLPARIGRPHEVSKRLLTLLSPPLVFTAIYIITEDL